VGLLSSGGDELEGNNHLNMPPRTLRLRLEWRRLRLEWRCLLAPLRFVGMIVDCGYTLSQYIFF
jgi:hypothetical protein